MIRISYIPSSDTEIFSSPERNILLQTGNLQVAEQKKHFNESPERKRHKNLTIEYEDLPEPPAFSQCLIPNINESQPNHISFSNGKKKFVPVLRRHQEKPLSSISIMLYRWKALFISNRYIFKFLKTHFY